ncbi:uncharacterized protein LOC124278118 [Haliotis rubra]|uniref:uncharacterized protein LOC124278118 n=1 Tax=Haliotis rubra TaxID=36100 RepID=UPI001EE5D268|nr:uncharacterized protein LOC124278118 [Haliotis rubra]
MVPVVHKDEAQVIPEYTCYRMNTSEATEKNRCCMTNSFPGLCQLTHLILVDTCDVECNISEVAGEETITHDDFDCKNIEPNIFSPDWAQAKYESNCISTQRQTCSASSTNYYA